MRFDRLSSLRPFSVCALAPVLVAGPALTCVIPKIMAALFIASGVLTVAAHAISQRRFPRPDPQITASLGALVLYGAVSAFWSVGSTESVYKALDLGLLFAITAFLVPIISSFGRDDIRKIGSLIQSGFAIGIFVFAVERCLNYPLYNALHPDHMNVVVDVKENKAIVLLALWSYLAVPFSNGGLSQRLLFGAGVLALAVLTFTSPSQSAKLFLILAATILAISRVFPSRITLPIAGAGIMGLMLAMPFVPAVIGHFMDWRHMPELGYSILSRLEIWEQAANRIIERPVIGWGLDTAPLLPNRGETSILYSRLKLPIAHLHPHNAPLQMWFEMGAVGVLLVVAFVAGCYARVMAMANEPARRYAVFVSSSTFLYTLTIWGIWQTWFLATLCLVGVMTLACASAIKSRTEIASAPGMLS